MKSLQITIGIMCSILILSKYISSEILDSDEYSMESEESVELDESEELKGIRFSRGHVSKEDFCVETDGICRSTSTGADTIIDTDKQNRILLSSESCGLVSIKRSFRKVVGGRNSEIGAWPWLALLAYDTVVNIAFTCSGSLITNRHIITAAHCILFNLIFVRLGEFDLSNDKETHHLDLNITKVIKLDFNRKSGHNDLAIVVLAESVQFTDLISPICLPTLPKLRAKSYVGTKPFVAGWGYTIEQGKSAKILQELQISVLDNQVCYDRYKAKGVLDTEDQFDKTVICAGELEGGKDTCQGDSGGPLMMPEWIDGTMRYFIIGVVSRGQGCARKEMAASYTNIPYHVDWILKNLV